MFAIVVEKKATWIPDRDARDKQGFLEVPVIIRVWTHSGKCAAVFLRGCSFRPLGLNIVIY